jgi:hypothetical protein
MKIPSRACGPLINAIQATTMAAILTAADIPPAQATATILDLDLDLDPDQALVPGLVPMADRDLDLTAMTIITAANRRS